MHVWKKIFSAGGFKYFLLSVFIIFIAQFPILLHVWHTPKDHYYPLLDQVSPSDYYYIALVRYGAGDNWLIKIPYVVTEHKESFIQILFVLLGKISKITGIGPAEVLFLSKIGGGIVFLLSVILFLRAIVPRDLKLPAFLIFLFSQPLPSLKASVINEGYSLWVWHFGEAARRISLMPPHYTLGKGLAILSLFFIFLYEKRLKSKILIGAILSAVLSGIIYPPVNFIILFSLILTIAVFSVIYKFRLTNIKSIQISGFILYLLSLIIPLILLKVELIKGYPWNMWNRVELGWNDPSMHFEFDYFRMFWWLFILVILMLPKIIREGKEKLYVIFLFIWGVSAFLLFPFANLLSIGKFRFTEGAQIVPLAILSAIWLKEKMSKLRQIKYVFYSLFFGYYLIFAFFVFKEDTLRFWPYWGNVYFPPEDVAAFNFLDKAIPVNSTVLADMFPSNYIPAFASVRTPLGFSDFYPAYTDYEKDMEITKKIMENSIPAGGALNFFKKLKIEYIYFDKSVYGSINLYPELLEQKFENQKIRIYKVKI